MRIKLKFTWVILLAVIGCAMAWGKTQSDVTWLRESTQRIEKRLDAMGVK